MIRFPHWFLVSLLLTGLVASVQAYAQSEPSEALTVNTEVQRTLEDARIAASSAAVAAQTEVNTQDIAEQARMSGTQDFILKLVAIVMPLLIAMMTGLMLYIQIKQKSASEARQVEQRADLILVARSINGMKTELVARSELAAFLEGAAIDSASAEARVAELQEAVRIATEQANVVAHSTVTELDKKQFTVAEAKGIAGSPVV